MLILDCKASADKILRRCEESIRLNGYTPTLAVVSVGNDEASKIYMRNKKKTCESVGIEVREYHYDDISQSKLEYLIDELNEDDDVNGIMVQLPLPKPLNHSFVTERIAPSKDVDGLVAGSWFDPCTPDGILHLLDDNRIPLAGKHAVVVGKSKLVGMPMAEMLMYCGSTVTVCNSKTQDLKKFTKDADILICAVGHPKLITADMVKSGVVIVDVGINRVDGKVCGDVDFEGMLDIPVQITKVPGGVGKLTVAMVAEHTLKAYLN